MMKKIAAVLLSLGLLSACQTAQPNIPQNKGALRITVQFPKQGFMTQLIRPETRVIYVAVYNESRAGEAPQIFGPITPRNPQVRLSQLPAGNQTIVAAAYDSQKQILTAGRSLALVKANALSQASLELEADYSQKLAAEQLKLLQGLQIQLPALDTQLATDLQPSQILNPNIPVNVPVTEGLAVNTGARSESAPDAGQALKTAATPTPVASRAASSSNYQPVQSQATPEPAAAEPTVSEPSVSEPAAAAQATPAPTAPAASGSAAAAEKAKKEKEAKEKKEKAEKEAKEKKEKEEKAKKDKHDKDHHGHDHDHDHDHDDDDDDRSGRGRGNDGRRDRDDD